MKYKVGDKVRIKSHDWYNKNKDNYGAIYAGNGFCFWKNMVRHCGEIMKITSVKVDPEDSNKGFYFMENSDERWTDGMIEGLVEEEMSLDKAGQITDFEYEGLVYTLPQGYQFVDENGNVINATKIVLEKKKQEYPKTFLGCCDVLGIEDTISRGVKGYKSNLLDTFQKLFICRDAYWKIAGEEMGLGKPWEPDWKNSEERRYSIVNIEGDINLPEKTLTKWILKVTNKILVFPTEGMRDAFYENFKELIGQCKELL